MNATACSRTHPERLKRGIDHPCAKLTDTVILAIRAQARQGATDLAMAVRFGVSARTVGQIVRRETWKHVPEEGLP